MAYALAAALPDEHIVLDLPDESRDGVVAALLDTFVAAGRLSADAAASMRALIDAREALGTTALGGGVAVPHARADIAEPLVACALLENGRDGWHALDDAPVHAVFLLITPCADEGPHRDALKAVMAFARVPAHIRALRNCATPDDVRRALE